MVTPFMKRRIRRFHVEVVQWTSNTIQYYKGWIGGQNTDPPNPWTTLMDYPKMDYTAEV